MNELTIIYKIENNEKIKIFDENFVKNNKENCVIIVDGKEMELCSELYISENEKKEIN